MLAVLSGAVFAFACAPQRHQFARPRASLSATAADPADTALQALSLPAQPSPTLDASDVCLAICRGLQHVDVPTQDRGFERLFYFATYECRAALTARRGKETLERFVEECTTRPSQALSPLVRCGAFTLDEATMIEGTPTRGALATIVVALQQPSAFRFASGFERPKDTEGSPYAASGDSELVRFTLQKERRPPLQDCWLVKEILPQRLHNLGDGDSGATCT